MKILEAESEIYDILLLVLKIFDVTEELYVCLVSISNLSFVNLSSRKIIFVKIEEKVVCCLSSLFGLCSSCFSQKFVKERDCWIFVCWLHFCLKQIFTSDVEHNVPTSRHGSVSSIPCLILRTRLFV